jgi:hypothetical protein
VGLNHNSTCGASKYEAVYEGCDHSLVHVYHLCNPELAVTAHVSLTCKLRVDCLYILQFVEYQGINSQANLGLPFMGVKYGLKFDDL